MSWPGVRIRVAIDSPATIRFSGASTVSSSPTESTLPGKSAEEVRTLTTRRLAVLTAIAGPIPAAPRRASSNLDNSGVDSAGPATAAG